MSTTSLSAEPAKLRDVSQKNHVAMKFFHLYEIFICMGFSSVWDFHLYGIFICMAFLLYGFFTCMAFLPVWLF
jgi:hypothetical protein